MVVVVVGHAQVRGSLAAVGQRGGGANSKGLGIHYLRSSVCMTEWVGQGRRRNESELVKEIDNIHRGNVEPAFCNLDMRVHYRMCSTGCALQDVQYRMNTRSQGTRPTLQCLHNGGYRQQHTRSV
jgi:hypothetical protein